MELTGISLVCPAYYDEKNIGPLVRRCVEVLSGAGGEFEIIVVDDGSPDGTGRAADGLAAEIPQVIALHHAWNRGHGGAVKTGMARAKYPVIAVIDGDGQYDPGDLLVMLEKLGTADIVQGRRAAYPNGAARAVMSRAYNTIARAMFGVPVRDLGCGIKVLKKEVLAGMTLPETDGIFMQGELIIKAHFAGLRVTEETVSSRPRESGRSSSMKPRNVLRLARDMIRLKSELKGSGG